MTAELLAPFAPTPAQSATLIDHLADPDNTLRDIAELNNTTLEALCAYLNTPEFIQRQLAIQTAMAARLRHEALCHLHMAAKAAANIIQGYVSEAYNADVGRTPEAREQHRRARETARKAAVLLLRLVTFDPANPRLPKPRLSRPALAVGNTLDEPRPDSELDITPAGTPRLRRPELDDLLDQLANLQLRQVSAELIDVTEPTPALRQTALPVERSTQQRSAHRRAAVAGTVSPVTSRSEPAPTTRLAVAAGAPGPAP